MAIRINITTSGGGDSLNYNQLKTDGKGIDGVDKIGYGANATTLDAPNPFGNLNRFTNRDGLQTWTEDIAIDWTTYRESTGKVWGYKRTPVGDGSTYDYNGLNTLIQGLNVAGFEDWKFANVRFIEGIVNYNGSMYGNGRWLQPFQPQFISKHIGTSTEDMDNSAQLYAYMNASQFKQTWAKSSAALFGVAVREFDISEINI